MCAVISVCSFLEEIMKPAIAALLACSILAALPQQAAALG
jgi:hypothetical protein